MNILNDNIATTILDSCWFRGLWYVTLHTNGFMMSSHLSPLIYMLLPKWIVIVPRAPIHYQPLAEQYLNVSRLKQIHEQSTVASVVIRFGVTRINIIWPPRRSWACYVVSLLHSTSQSRPSVMFGTPFHSSGDTCVIDISGVSTPRSRTVPSESRTSIVSPSIISMIVSVCVCVVGKSGSVDRGRGVTRVETDAMGCVGVEIELGVVVVIDVSLCPPSKHYYHSKENCIPHVWLIINY